MKLIILAGGLGTRLSEETDKIPKPMVKIGKKPMLWHIMKYYSVYGIKDFLICGGYKIDIIKKFFKNKNNIEDNWSVKIINTGATSNTGERIRRVKRFVNESFFLTYGDGLSNINIKKLLTFHKKNKKVVVTLTSVRPMPKYGKLLFKKNLITKFYEKEKSREAWVNGGFFVCNKILFKYFKDKNSILESDVLTKLAYQGKLQGYKHKDFWYCMDTLRDKRYLNSLYNSGNAPWIVWN
jgi:glucose-1-phosphate cytidylyltransferase